MSIQFLLTKPGDSKHLSDTLESLEYLEKYPEGLDFATDGCLKFVFFSFDYPLPLVDIQILLVTKDRCYLYSLRTLGQTYTTWAISITHIFSCKVYILLYHSRSNSGTNKYRLYKPINRTQLVSACLQFSIIDEHVHVDNVIEIAKTTSKWIVMLKGKGKVN